VPRQSRLQDRGALPTASSPTTSSTWWLDEAATTAPRALGWLAMKYVVALDGSPQASLGARWVATLPLSAVDEVLVTSIVEPPVLLGAWRYVRSPAMAESYANAWEESKHEARRIVESGTALCAESGGAVRATVREGHPISELIALVEEVAADLLVVGPHGRDRFESILLGSVSQSLLHAMPTSILVAREPVRAPRRVLLAFDGSPHSLAAARFLVHFPLPPGARIDVLAVVDGLHTRYAAHGAADLKDLIALERRGAAEVIQRAVEVLEAAGRTTTPAIRHGDPKREILAAARGDEVDLVVTGARGLGGFPGMILGSVSRAVSKAAPCSALVVATRAGANE